MWPSALCTAQRVTVFPRRLKRWPVPPARPRAMTNPVSGWRSRMSAGCSVAAQQASSRSIAALASTASQRWRGACSVEGSWCTANSIIDLYVYTSYRRATQSTSYGELGDPLMTSQDPTPLQRGSGVAVWRQIAHRLEGDLKAGGLKDRSRPPTEVQLAARFTVKRPNVRR